MCANISYTAKPSSKTIIYLHSNLYQRNENNRFFWFTIEQCYFFFQFEKYFKNYIQHTLKKILIYLEVLQFYYFEILSIVIFF